MLKPLPDSLLHKNIECVEADPFNDPDLYMAVMHHNKQQIPAWWYRWYNASPKPTETPLAQYPSLGETA